MIDRLVLHIGSHKTGSTAIQRSLRDATDLLLERGILYPRTGRSGVGHAQLANELVNTSGPLTAIPSHLGLIEEVRASRPRTLLLSAEGFTNKGSARQAEWVRGLCEALQPQDLRIVGYVRPQWECLESAYADRVRVGMVWVPFAEWLEGALEGESSFDYLRRFAPWREEFAERLETRLYTAPSLTGGDAVDDFWHAVGLGTPPVHRPHHENRIRSGARTIEMLRRLRAFLAEHHLDGLVRVRETLLGAYRRIQAEPIEDLPFSPLTSEDVTRITKRFAPSNEEFVRDYLPGVHGNPLSSPKRDEPSTWSLSEASERERRLFAKLVEEALRQMPLHQLEDVPVAGVVDAEHRRHQVDPVEAIGRLGARLILQQTLEDEVTEFLGRVRYERTGDPVSHRNGYEARTVKTTSGALELERPRVRDASKLGFESKLLGKGVARTHALESLVICSFLRGLSVRDVEAALAETFEEAVISKSTVARVCRETAERYRAWCARRLEAHDLVYLFLDAIYLKLRPDDEPAEGVLVAWGITLEGQKILRCTVHALRSVTAKLPERHHHEVKARCWRIFDEAVSAAEARTELLALAGDFKAAYPSAARVIERDADALVVHLRWPSQHRKRIRSTNLLERTFVEVRRRTKVIGRFPGETSALSLIWAVLELSSRGWRGVVMTPKIVAEIERLRRGDARAGEAEPGVEREAELAA